jgi:hypothetical protein
MRKSKFIYALSVLSVIGAICTGCSKHGNETASDAANNDMTPAKMGMTRQQLDAKMHGSMSQSQAGAPQNKMPPAAVKAGAH